MQLTWFNVVKSAKILQVLSCLATAIALYISIAGINAALSSETLSSLILPKNSIPLLLLVLNGACALYAFICLIFFAVLKRFSKTSKILVVFFNQVSAVLIAVGLCLFINNEDYLILITAMQGVIEASTRNDIDGVAAVAAALSELQYARIGVLVCGVSSVILFVVGSCLVLKMEGDGRRKEKQGIQLKLSEAEF